MRDIYIIKDQGLGGYVAWSDVSLVKDRERAMQFTQKDAAKRWMDKLTVRVKEDTVRLRSFRTTFTTKKSNPAYFIDPDKFDPKIIETQIY